MVVCLLAVSRGVVATSRLYALHRPRWNTAGRSAFALRRGGKGELPARAGRGVDRGDLVAAHRHLERVLRPREAEVFGRRGGAAGEALLPRLLRVRLVSAQRVLVARPDLPLRLAALAGQGRESDLVDLLFLHDADEVDEPRAPADRLDADQHAVRVGRVLRSVAAEHGEAAARVGQCDVAQDRDVALTLLLYVLLDVALPRRDADLSRAAAAARGQCGEGEQEE